MGAVSLWHWLLLLLIIVIDLLPAIIAFRRVHPSRFWILLLNLLLGWTGIGWVVALVWALSGRKIGPRGYPG